jgi:hypothetical protein
MLNHKAERRDFIKSGDAIRLFNDNACSADRRKRIDCLGGMIDGLEESLCQSPASVARLAARLQFCGERLKLRSYITQMAEFFLRSAYAAVRCFNFLSMLRNITLQSVWSIF